ncbi:MAG: DUF3137 domain-containing protein [Ruminococcus sp.]|jgi:hypothetical protein|nr:DUF3137 domain-containing protein [Ruminococcus sp.]
MENGKKYITSDELEAARLEVVRLGVPHKKKASVFFWIALASFLALIVATIVLTGGADGSAADVSVSSWIIVGLLTVSFIVFIILHGRHQKIYMSFLNPYNSMYKLQFLPTIFEESFEKVYAFEPQNGLSREIVKESGIFPTFDYIATNDYLRASHNGMNFEYCDIQLQEMHYESDSDGGRKQVIDTVFWGYFIIAEFDHFVDTPVFITAGGGHGNVITESPSFNQFFSVKCESEVDALRILTPAMIDYILNMKKSIKNDINLAFFDDKIFFNTRNTKDRFEIAHSIEMPISESRKNVDEDICYIKEILDFLNMRNLKSKSSRRQRTDEDFAGHAVYQNEQH